VKDTAIHRAGRTWLVVAAEEREFSGLLGRCGVSRALPWPGAAFAREVDWKGDRWWLVANGPGPTLVEQALKVKQDVHGIISTGFCGALDPALEVGAIVIAGTPVRSPASYCRGEVVSSDRVAVTAVEKRALYQSTGAAAVDMEYGEVKRIAEKWGVPAGAVRVVSDTAGEDMPLDFNKYRDRNGRFSRVRIALAALARPFTAIPGLLRLDRNCRLAADKLGEFFANSEFE
jgi:adenosylhomocysteine nucleosidase